MKPSELLIKTPPKVLIYGPPGAGKTTWVSTYGKGLQLLDFDGNIAPIVTMKDSHTVKRAEIDVLPFRDDKPHTTAVAYRKFTDYIMDVVNQCALGKFPFTALAVDSFTMLADACQRSIMANSGGITNAPQIQHWGVIFQEIERVIVTLKSLPIPVFVLFHQEVNDSDAGRSIDIAIPGKRIPVKIPVYFTEIWYMRSRAAAGGKVSVCLQTQKDSQLTACRTCAQVPNMLDITTLSLGDVLNKYVTLP